MAGDEKVWGMVAKGEDKTTSRLLSLPPEIQLIIWEFTVTSAEPLFINCACDSSYGGWTEEYYADRERWEKGERHPPWQPGLTRTCASIRADALKMFYKNTFQAGYCYECDLDIVIDWLKTIGPVNRECIGKFVFFDANRKHDRNMPKDLTKVLRSDVVRIMGGRVESTYDGEGCKHVVKFGPHGDEDLMALKDLFEEETSSESQLHEVRSISQSPGKPSNRPRGTDEKDREAVKVTEMSTHLEELSLLS
ncbi:uncharacterized protein MYCFIDRAFT_80019 [Pseudocercospora fijiensis CIRAD86]|uniref:F-box domain-containing protein n=1 Tax=Pseudocercospora fijiensis (strain CIRAD86) TaxID=383855 RepID=N1QBP8_PSEFD|nr:uncharacterized protein MYCFIDRAFT_80019 [Pseudocercospora fijiensis CIRAD86]EME88647.1 hypothetical protein MYCFIDRAFT_80019 [Pseudocercospora fijiensis CIRAD86]